MKQKLALSCALVHQPSVLFLDEPTTGVDPVSRKELWQMLGMLKERGITIVAATPYLDEVRRCDRVAFLDRGTIRGIDTPDVILDRFKDIFNPPGIERADEAVAAPQQPTESENVIEVSHLVKAFGSFHAVDDISFSVKRGEIFGFLGANGAGKTTAMHMLTGLNQPTSGTGTVVGYDIRTQHEEIKKHIGYMSQKFSLYEDLTVAENIRLFAGIYGMRDDEIRRKTDELLERLKFEDHKNDLVGSLPLGWKQKLAFSVSIFHEPGIVFRHHRLCDHPLHGRGRILRPHLHYGRWQDQRPGHARRVERALPPARHGPCVHLSGSPGNARRISSHPSCGGSRSFIAKE